MISGWIILIIAIVGALVAIILTAIIYRLVKNYWPNWKIVIIAGFIGGIIAEFFL